MKVYFSIGVLWWDEIINAKEMKTVAAYFIIIKNKYNISKNVAKQSEIVLQINFLPGSSYL